MNTRSLILAAALLASVSAQAFAGNSYNPKPPVPPSSPSTINQGGAGIGVGVGVGLGGKGGNASSISTTSAAGGNSSATVSPGSGATINAQPAIAPDLAGLVGTGCMGSASGSGAGGGIVSLGFGFTYKDHDCELRAFAASLLAVGQPAAALNLLLQNEDVAKAMSATRAAQPAPAVAVAPAAVQQAAYVPAAAPTCTTIRAGKEIPCDQYR